MDEHDALVELREPQSEYEARADFATVMLEHLKTSGVQQAHKDNRIRFTSVTGGPGDYVCVEGRYPEGDKELSALAVVSSWLIVHTVFTLHYAHRYYQTTKHKPREGGLAFPEEPEPDYLDFAYFLFVIGMTCQVSDVQITARTMRI